MLLTPRARTALNCLAHRGLGYTRNAIMYYWLPLAIEVALCRRNRGDEVTV